MDALVSFANLGIGLEAVLSLHSLLMLVLGVVLGIMIGATPGLSPSMGVALLVPVSYGMDPLPAFMLFVAAYQAANYGGSITAIAVNAPGTPASVVTALDGYKLTQDGKAGLALSTAATASAFGGFVGALVLILFAIPIAQVGLLFGPAEYFWLAILGLCTVVGLGGNDWLKALVGVGVGLVVATIGLDPFTGTERFTFGVPELFDGIPFIPAMIGLFALGEILFQLEGDIENQVERPNSRFFDFLPDFMQLWRLKWVALKSSIIGTLIGIIPGAGATIASFISYSEAQRSSKEREKFENGAIEGVTASEAANSSSVGGALVPLLALGIPGSATDAVLLGALALHGLVAGPELFQTRPDIAYGIFVCLLLANLLIFVFGLLGNSIWLRVITIPRSLLYPFIIVLCLVGSYTLKSSLIDSWICLVFGVLGWAFKRHGYKPAPIVLGLVLGPMIETNFRRALLIDGYNTLINSTLCIVLMFLSTGFLLYPIIQRAKAKE